MYLVFCTGESLGCGLLLCPCSHCAFYSLVFTLRPLAYAWLHYTIDTKLCLCGLDMVVGSEFKIVAEDPYDIRVDPTNTLRPRSQVQ